MFCERLRQEGFACRVYPRLGQAARRDFGVEQGALCDWLKALPKPVAILAANDVRGRQVLDSCLKAGVAVPQEAALLGVDNDELLCETTNPQMSSIQMSSEQAGFEAARVLDGMMRGIRREAPRQTIITYGFSSLVTRQSTETVQISDALVARALEFIRINAGLNIRVSDVANHLGITPRWAESRFKESMGHSLHQEIHRVRMTTARAMVTSTDRPFSEIAARCGFQSANHLCKLFKAAYGCTMGSLRRVKGANPSTRNRNGDAG